MTSISVRLGELIKELELSQSSFADRISATRQTIGSIIKNDRKVSSDILEKIIRTFPEVNIEWLITGEGNILKEDKQKQIVELKKRIEELEETNISIASQLSFNTEDTHLQVNLLKTKYEDLHTLIFSMLKRMNEIGQSVDELKSSRQEE